MEKTIADMSNLKINETEVKNHLVYIKDKNGVYIINPFIDINKRLLEIKNCTSLLLSSKNIAAVADGKLEIYDLIDFKLLKTFDYEQISAIDFSPNGKYLIIIQKPAVPFNLKVVDLEASFQLKISFHSTIHPNQYWPQIRFSKNEEFLFRQIKSNIDVFELNKIDYDFKYHEKDSSNNTENLQSQIISFSNVVNYSFAEIKVEENTNEIALLLGRCLLDEKTKKKKSLFGFYRLSDCSKPIKEFPISLCDRMIIKVSPDNSCALVQSICDDTSNTSYYGESSLYHVDLLFGKFAKITTPDGPIHDFNWTPANQFIVCAGFSPSKTTIYSNQNKFIKEICNSKVNLIRVSPDGRILCMAGFGNMNGDLEFYNLKDYKIIGKSNFYCGVTLNWSYDSKFLVGAVTSPRIRVDNEFKVITYNGESVCGQKFTGEIYDSNWVYSDPKLLGIEKIDEFPLEVSKEYLKKLELDKQKAKTNVSTMRRLDMPLSAAAKKSSIPGMKK